jgi:hypothetical protein
VLASVKTIVALAASQAPSVVGSPRASKQSTARFALKPTSSSSSCIIAIVSRTPVPLVSTSIQARVPAVST